MPQTYYQLRDKIQLLQQKADTAKAKAAVFVIRRIKEAVSFYALTAEELGFNAEGAQAESANRPGGSKTRSSRGSSGPKARTAKFRNEQGEEWVGRGPRPQWLREALSTGKSLEDFEVGRAVLKGQAKSVKASKPVQLTKLEEPGSEVKPGPKRRIRNKTKSASVARTEQLPIKKRASPSHKIGNKSSASAVHEAPLRQSRSKPASTTKTDPQREESVKNDLTPSQPDLTTDERRADPVPEENGEIIESAVAPIPETPGPNATASPKTKRSARKTKKGGAGRTAPPVMAGP